MVAERRVITTPSSQMGMKKQKWLWAPGGEGVIPLNTGTICAGQGGEGKSTFLMYLAAMLTRGKLEGEFMGRRGSVLILSPEDSWEHTINPRLVAAGASRNHIHQMQIEVESNSTTHMEEARFPLDIDQLKDAVKQTRAKMVIIDPAPALMAGDLNKVGDVRAAYDPLIRLAQEMNIAAVTVNHFGKSNGSVSQKLSGSHAWRDVFRSYLAFASDPDTDEKILTVNKSNYGRVDLSFGYGLVDTPVEVDDGEVTQVGRVNFIGRVTNSVDEVLLNEAKRQSGKEPTQAERILDCFESAQTLMDAQRISTQTGIKVANVRTNLTRLRDQGRLKSSGAGIYCLS